MTRRDERAALKIIKNFAGKDDDILNHVQLQTTSSPLWNNLLPEILLMIFDFLGSSSISKCSKTCVNWRLCALPKLYNELRIHLSDIPSSLRKACVLQNRKYMQNYVPDIRKYDFLTPLHVNYGMYIKKLCFHFSQYHRHLVKTKKMIVLMILSGCPNVQRISIDDSNLLGDTDVVDMLDIGCKKLECLDINNCKKLNENHKRIFMRLKELCIINYNEDIVIPNLDDTCLEVIYLRCGIANNNAIRFPSSLKKISTSKVNISKCLPLDKTVYQ